MAMTRLSAAQWFTRVMWVGIAANLALSVPTLFAPARMAQLTGVPVPEPLVWLRFSALLLILLSAFYVPSALDPIRYRIVANLAVAARLVGVIFFVLFQPAEYHVLGYFDLVFFVPEAALLLAMQSASRAHATAVASGAAGPVGR
jgi:hypothetical protein